ncbi:hypothetical protein SLEP1_g55704 [Rubroshorea leprosula]|uniref:Disease resistance protein n=1 Tax=Rubroshorea leprosula TaxID=152421 RepID=A0AAV5MK10_9ROSI|nr:hypothetical protein SLEP1_g55704 [Rubroshorea leprosula]
MVDLTSLTKLRIREIAELTRLPKSFTQSLTALETLYIEQCNDLTCLWEERREIEQGLLPFNLKHLSLERCGALESLPDAMMMRMVGSNSSNTSMLMLRLEKLEIYDCDSLKSFPRRKLPIMLKYLRMVDYMGLESLPDADGDNNSNLHLEIRNVPCLYSSEGCHQPPAFVKKFTVTDGGKWLESFPERMLQHCTRLQAIDIHHCKMLKNLPALDCVSSLLDLPIFDCEALESLPEELGLCTPNLKSLRIRRCENFKSLPNTMYQLKSLQQLCIADCLSIEFIPEKGLPPNLTDLQLEDCGALTMGLQNLTSLRWLAIEQKFPLDIVLPSSLTSLQIWNEENLKSIPWRLFQNLSSFETLWISNCQKLQSLPREAFPPSLGQLCISEGPHLKRQHFEAKGDYWTLTWSIPCVLIDEDELDALILMLPFMQEVKLLVFALTAALLNNGWTCNVASRSNSMKNGGAHKICHRLIVAATTVYPPKNALSGQFKDIYESGWSNASRQHYVKIISRIPLLYISFHVVLREVFMNSHMNYMGLGF